MWLCLGVLRRPVERPRPSKFSERAQNLYRNAQTLDHFATLSRFWLLCSKSALRCREMAIRPSGIVMRLRVFGHPTGVDAGENATSSRSLKFN